MQETLHNPETTQGRPKRSPITIPVATVAILALVAIVWLLFQPSQSRRSSPALDAAKLKMSAAEQEYKKKIEVGNLALSRAENFLHQEVTILNGEVFNGGAEPVSDLLLTTIFSDDMNQIVLRETRGVLGTPERSLAAGERRAFEISFDYVPNSWNMQSPVVRVEYLHLPAHK